MAQKVNASTRNPCPICGHTDWCCTVKYPDGDVYWCARAGGEDPVVAGGIMYDLIATKERGAAFSLYMSHEDREASKERWIKEQKDYNTNWKRNSKSRSSIPRSPQPLADRREHRESSIETEEPLSHAQLDKVYRRMLKLLVLEKKHRDLLLHHEWSCARYPSLGDDILRRYPIRSLPPEDKVRFSPLLRDEYTNKSRKEIVQTLLMEFGDLRGVPGFYMRGGQYWAGKKESERWTFSSAEGIIFPCYDEYGYLYRIRIRSDYPHYTVRNTRGESFDGGEGDFIHAYGESGEHLWYFQEKGKKEKELAYGPNVKKIELEETLVPVIGKPEGKYKNFASEILRESESGVVKNILEGGSKSGSPYSFYLPASGVDWRVVLITEGEKKGIVTSEIKRMPVLSLPGVQSMAVCFEREEKKPLADFLKEKGTVAVIIAYDADKESNEMVKNAETQIVRRFLERGFSVYTAEWSKDFSKGIDDILLMGMDIALKAQS